MAVVSQAQPIFQWQGEFSCLRQLQLGFCIVCLNCTEKTAELQGTAQGALYGALALSQGFGPLAFAYLFQLGTRSDSPWTYFPGMCALGHQIGLQSSGFGIKSEVASAHHGWMMDLGYAALAGAPYLFGSFLMLICTYVACTIDRKSADRGRQEQDSNISLRGVLSSAE